MNRFIVLACLTLFAVEANAADCDRACLKNMMTTYLNALAAQDPSKAPLAANVRFTEDSKDLKVGEGFWKTATKVGDYRQDFIDVKEQVVAAHVIVEESGRPAKFTARLKVADGKITEIETLVVHGGEGVGGGANLVVRPDMGVEPPAALKNKREELIRAADFYPRGLTAGGFDKVDAPFAKDAFRIENGMVMAGPGCGAGARGGTRGAAGAGPRGANAGPGAPGAAPRGANAGPGAAPRGANAGPGAAPRGANAGPGAVNARSPQDVSTCQDIKTQRIIEHPDLTKSVVAVDEEQGIALIWMNFGDTGSYGAGNALVIFEAFKVFGGEMHAVQAFMKVLPKDTQRGWGKTLRGLE
ncbi:MAG TPA: hypothetical protein VFY29_16870 [Terriglobia bacterium]|nr:hypothetical protein [Terriglobia bacterium]